VLTPKSATSSHLSPLELQGHAIKNQDILIASGTLSLKGSDGMTAVDDDVAAAVRPYLSCHRLPPGLLFVFCRLFTRASLSFLSIPPKTRYMTFIH
jgi:hypothetical protein